MNKHSIFDKPVAILGGGACGQTFAADFILAGYEVNLYEMVNFADKTLGPVLESNEITLSGEQRNFKWFKREGLAKINLITTDMELTEMKTQLCQLPGIIAQSTYGMARQTNLVVKLLV